MGIYNCILKKDEKQFSHIITIGTTFISRR